MSCSPKLFHLPFRSRDKEPRRCDPYPSLFVEYIESDRFELSDNTMSTASSDDSSNLFDFTTSSGASDAADLSADARHEHTAAPAWQGSAMSLEQNSNPPHIEPSSGADKANTALDVDHLGLEDFSCAAPASWPDTGVELSPPPSPTPELSVTKKRFVLPIRSITGPKSPIRKLQRMCSPSPKMMSPRHQRVGTYHGAWAKRLEAASEKLNLHTTSQTPISPPSSANLHQSPRARTFVPSDFLGFDAAPLITPRLEDPMSPTSHAIPNPYLPHSQALLTPLTSPTFALQSPALNSPFQQQQAQPLTFNPNHLHSNQAANATLLHTPPPSQKLPNTAWNPEPQDFLDYSYSATSPSLTNHKAEAWWNTASALQPDHQFSNCSANLTLIGLGLEGMAAPDLRSEQLLDQYDLSTATFDSLLPPSESALPHMGSAEFTSPTLLSPVPALMPSTPITPAHTYHRSRNSSASPTPVTPSSRHMRGASRSHRRSHSQHHRRRPSSKGGDLSATPGKSRGEGRDRPVSVGFVNFTPDDSRKILTGVAPSGSSKTKARREKEAQEKRRKLSEAARRVVEEAGGDVEALEREGLLASIMAADP